MRNVVKSSAIGAAAGFLNGFFGSGGGTVVVPAMERFLKVTAHKAHATAIAIILPLSLVSVFVYFRGMEVDWTTVLAVSAGGMAGGFIGSKLLYKFSAGRLHKIFGFFMIAAAVRMII